MSLIWEKEQLQAQIIDTERLLSLAKDHPLMSYSMKKKLDNLKKRLEEFPVDIKEPKVRLLFSGGAVKGSQGIKTKFISQTLRPFQELIKTQTALLRYGKVGKRGVSKSSKFSELYLTALPTGSFGVELSQIDANDFFAEEDVSTAINQVMDLIDAATKSDEAFENILEKTPARNLTNLRSFLKQIDEEHSILKLESGTHKINIPEDKIHKGFERVNGAVKEDEEIFIDGTLRGILLESARFEFIDKDGFKYTGFVNPKVDEKEILLYMNQTCKVHIRKSKTRFNSGTQKVTYELLEISKTEQ